LVGRHLWWHFKVVVKGCKFLPDKRESFRGEGSQPNPFGAEASEGGRSA